MRHHWKPLLMGTALALCCASVTGGAHPGTTGTNPGEPLSAVQPGDTAEWSPSWFGASSAKPWSQAEEETVHLVNQARSRNGCDPLEVDERLTRTAREHSRHMAGRGTVTHVGSQGRSYTERAKAAGYDRPSGEVIAAGYETASETVRNWLESSGHRKVIMNCDSVDTGVGVVTTEDGVYWTQVFGFGS
ncbi:CAP domain-containing protein [Nocardiopsis listeri]|uniref:CAP domain-containing protein n=1 Tax=Nocardiopsis listeri TaxID=53440 RepID=UPI0009FEA627|nr:CAP domain-containing protein [Nocardiopsis listeri]